MSPSPAPDPPPPPIGLDQETPLQAIIQQTRYLLQYLKEAASSKNPTQSLNFDQIFHVLSNVSDVHSNLEKLNSLEKNKETVINPSSDLKSEPQILDKILERLDRIERRSAIPAPPPPATWAAAVIDEVYCGGPMILEKSEPLINSTAESMNREISEV
ncbi:hypothetical protein PtB15_9B549 [Puccinia triticina]|nr:hypothetical protein PtB15_9B549 [Puccinia triticina]